MKELDDKTNESQKENIQRISQEPSNGGTAQLVDNRESTTVQRKLQGSMSAPTENNSNPIQRRNNTGLPDNLKSGIENLSGYSMDDVKVHYNSSKPTQLKAHAYAQGTDIHVASGQEKHLAHEAWHVVQQKQGRVKPTMQLKSKVNINDDAGLEKEADVMGERAFNTGRTIQTKKLKSSHKTSNYVIQPVWQHAKATKKSGATIYDYKEKANGRIKVKKGNLFGFGKKSLLTVEEGDVLMVNPEESVGSYDLGKYPIKGQEKEGYIYRKNYDLITDWSWQKDANLAASLLDGYLETHKVQQHITGVNEFKESTKDGMDGMFAALKKNRDKGLHGFFNGGKIKDPMTDIKHWQEMGESLIDKPASEELIPMTCDQSTAIIMRTLSEDSRFISSLTVIKQGDPKHHGHWYVLANRDPNEAPPKHGEPLKEGEFIIDIWGSLRLKEGDPNTNTVVHREGKNAVFDASMITTAHRNRGTEYVKKKYKQQNFLKVMLNVENKNSEINDADLLPDNVTI